MKMANRFVASCVLFALIITVVIPIGQAHAAQPKELSAASAIQNELVSPEGFLNSDGSLHLDGSTSGSLDLSGWDVQIDPQRGPVFSLPESVEPAPLASVTTGSWSDLGGGGGTLNNAVNAIAIIGTDVYVGGSFTDADNIPEADYLAKWNGSSWSAVSSNGAGGGSLNSWVLTLTASGTDLYVGGYFVNVSNNGTPVNAADYIAKWNGSSWSALGVGSSGNGALTGAVYAITVSGSNFYVGGTFSNINNNGTALPYADYIAKWDSVSGNWSALGNAGINNNGSLNATVRAIAIIGNDVYAGGHFTNVDNYGTVLAAADYIARWNTMTSNWFALSSNGAGNGSLGNNSSVYALAVSGTNLYVGGGFNDVNNGGTSLPAADEIAKWDGTNWSALGIGFTPSGSIPYIVNDIAISGSDIYITGGFAYIVNNNVSDQTGRFVAHWDGSIWAGLGSDGSGGGSLSGDNGFGNAIAVSGSNVYVGGAFYAVNNNGTVLGEAAYIAQWNGTDWSALGAAQGAITRTVNAVAISGTDVYVGGNFEDVSNDGIPIPEADYIAKWDGANWSALGTDGYGGGPLDSQVLSIAASGTDVYVGGWFGYLYDDGIYIPEADYIAKWDGDSWSALGNNGAGEGSLNSAVISIAVNGSDVYAGGYFYDVNNNGTPLNAADYIAKWDGANWSALGSNGSGNGSLTNSVKAVAVSGSDVYIGGDFLNVNNNSTSLNAADYIAKWDGSNWSALGVGSGGNGSLNSYVNAIAVSGSTVYVGGEFINVNNNGTSLNAADYIAMWDGTNWSALSDNGFGGGSLNDYVKSIAISGTDVYVGGQFSNVNNGGTSMPEADLIAKWDGTDWSAAGSDGGGDGSVGGPDYPYVNAMAANSTDVYIAGYFLNVNNNGTVLPYADYVAKFHTTIDVDITIGSTPQGSYSLHQNESQRVSYSGVNDGPVQTTGTNSLDIIPSARVLFGGVSYSELMGFPANQLTTEYIFPYYNNVAYDSQLRVGNLGAVSTTITVTLGTTVIDTYVLGAGAATRKNYAGKNGGPLRVSSSATDILATTRVLYSSLSYSELMGYPVDQLTDEYIFPYYNNVALNSQLRISNLGVVPTTITVTLGTTVIDSYTLGAGLATRKNYAGQNSGPLRVASSDTDIISTIRALYNGNSYSELMGYPVNQLTEEYWYPVYDNVSLDSQLRVSNVGAGSTTITVYSGGTQIDTYLLGAGAATRKNYAAEDDGPLHVVSSPEPILSTTRMLYLTPSFSSYYEMTGFPEDQLTTEYQFPWYNNVAFSSQIRFAVP